MPCRERLLCAAAASIISAGTDARPGANCHANDPNPAGRRAAGPIHRSHGDRGAALIIDRIGRIFATGRLNSLLLEVFAIFLGITASFALEEWRQQRQELVMFEHYLEGIYYDAARERATSRRSVYINNQLTATLNTLLSDEVDTLPEQELSTLVTLLEQGTPVSRPRNDGSYRALLSSNLTLALDDTLQQLHDLYAVRQQFLSYLDNVAAEQDVTPLSNFNLQSAGLPISILSWDENGHSLVSVSRQDLPMFAGVNRLLRDRGGAESQHGWAEAARRRLHDPDTRLLLRPQLDLLIEANDLTVAVMGINENIQAVVRERLPRLTLPVRTLGLLGSATEGGWLVPQAEPLGPEGGGGDWWSAEMNLRDGMAKFIANGNYGTSWGADYAWDVIDPMADPTHYLGDPAAVFPHGAGQLDGQNIPIRAGRYRVRFNIRSFEYQFVAVEKDNL
jgi:hypothetical protein